MTFGMLHGVSSLQRILDPFELSLKIELNSY